MHYLCFTAILTYASLSNSGINTYFQLANMFKPAAVGLQQASEKIIQESYRGKFYTTSISCHVVPTFHDHYFLYRRTSTKPAFQRNEKVQTTTSRLSSTLMLQTNQTHPVPQSVNVDARGRMPLLVIQWNNDLTPRLSLNKWSCKDASANHQTPCPAHS